MKICNQSFHHTPLVTRNQFVPIAWSSHKRSDHIVAITEGNNFIAFQMFVPAEPR